LKRTTTLSQASAPKQCCHQNQTSTMTNAKPASTCTKMITYETSLIYCKCFHSHRRRSISQRKTGRRKSTRR
jgi:hypothetical protein